MLAALKARLTADSMAHLLALPVDEDGEYKSRRIRLGHPSQKMDTRYVKLRNLLLDYMSVKAKACVMAYLLDLAAHIIMLI